MTEITAPKSAVTAEQFADEIREQLKYTQGVNRRARPSRLMCTSPRPPQCVAISWILDEDPDRHGQRTTPRPSATCPPSS